MELTIISNLLKEGEGVIGHTRNILNLANKYKHLLTCEDRAILDDNILGLFAHGRQTIQQANEALKEKIKT